jgi:hypothetical protein
MIYGVAQPSTGKAGRFIANRKAVASRSYGKYTPSSIDFIHSFYAVLRRWKSETAFFSDPEKITSHPSYQALVKNAGLVLNLIIDELRVEPSLLVWVLDDAFPDRPYSDDAVGDINEMTNAWIAWADRNGRQIQS